MKDGYLRGSIPRTPTARQVDVLAAFVAGGGSVADAAAPVGIRRAPRSGTWQTCERARVSRLSS